MACGRLLTREWGGVVSSLPVSINKWIEHLGNALDHHFTEITEAEVEVVACLSCNLFELHRVSWERSKSEKLCSGQGRDPFTCL